MAIEQVLPTSDASTPGCGFCRSWVSSRLNWFTTAEQLFTSRLRETASCLGGSSLRAKVKQATHSSVCLQTPVTHTKESLLKKKGNKVCLNRIILQRSITGYLNQKVSKGDAWIHGVHADNLSSVKPITFTRVLPLQVTHSVEQRKHENETSAL